MKILVTGGAGFIGINLVKWMIDNTNHHIMIIDKFTNPAQAIAVESVIKDNVTRVTFEQVDIMDANKIKSIFNNYNPDQVIHLAALCGVMRSVANPEEFIQTNVIGTMNMVKAAHNYWQNRKQFAHFKFISISTKNIYGSINPVAPAHTESSTYNPNSAYGASKVGADAIVRTWHHCYGLPINIACLTSCYGPYQNPNKLIPHILLSLVGAKKIEIYGNGQNIRDWLHVQDCAAGIYQVMSKGKNGETYNLGGNCEKPNVLIADKICNIMQELFPLQIKADNQHSNYRSFVNFTHDRALNDQRYSLNSDKAKNELGWQPNITFYQGMITTISWYFNNLEWCNSYGDKKYDIPLLKQLAESLVDSQNSQEPTVSKSA